MEFRPQFFIQSLFASFITIAPAIVFFIYGTTGSPEVQVTAPPDNAPMRAAWGLLFLSPFIFIILLIFFYISSRILFALKKLSFINHEIIVIVSSIALSAVMAHDSLNYFLLFSFINTCWLTIGVIAWYYSNKMRYNKFKNLRSLRSLGRAEDARPF